MPRAPRPDDLYRLRIATEPRLSPDGRVAVVTLQTVAPGFDGYRHALWLVPTDGSATARQLTLGARHDRHPRFSPDGRTLAFISDRRPARRGGRRPDARDGASDREDATQVYLLPLDGGEARRLTDLPRGVDAFEWSPDGTRLVVVSASHGATRATTTGAARHRRPAEPGAPPASDYRFVDRLDYMLNGAGFTYDQVDAPVARRRRDRRGHAPDRRPDAGRRAGLVARRHADRVHLEPPPRRRPRPPRTRHPRRRRRDARGDGGHAAARARRLRGPAWLPDGRTIAALGHRLRGPRGQPQRHLAVRGRRLRRDADRRPEPVRRVTT